MNTHTKLSIAASNMLLVVFADFAISPFSSNSKRADGSSSLASGYYGRKISGGGTSFKIHVYGALSIKKSDHSSRQDDLMLHS